MIKKYDSAALTKFKKDMIAAKGSAVQRELLAQARRLPGAEFVSWFDGQLQQRSATGGIIVGNEDVALPPVTKFTASAFNAICIRPEGESDADILWNTWGGMAIHDSASPAVWARVTMHLIQAGKLLPYDLMEGANGNRNNDGRTKIDTALANGKTDECVRDFLRHLCGLEEVRGARSLYQNCPLARAWWQIHIARSFSPDNWRSALEVLRHKVVWEFLSDKMASRLTVLGDVNIRDGIILYLLGLDNESLLYKRAKFNRWLTFIGVMTSWRALGYFSPEKVKDIVGELVDNAVRSATASENGNA